jgi:hypothetical protein
VKDLTGIRCGRLTVLRETDRKRYWLCQCSCGKMKTVRSDHLVDGPGRLLIRSCGCLISKGWGDPQYQELITKYPSEYSIWGCMKKRCDCQTSVAYPDYGGRGIKVCEEWQDGFSRFLTDMGPKPEGFTLERVDNRRGYSKENCIWASRKDQARNRRSNALVWVGEKSYCLAEIQDMSGIDMKLLSHWRLSGREYKILELFDELGWN